MPWRFHFGTKKIDLKTLSECDNDLFNVVVFSSMVLQNRDVWRLFKRNKVSGAVKKQLVAVGLYK